jgi:tetratricopeptide (TPR) repeat protein
MESAPLEVFISYAHEDEKLREALGKHLSLLKRRGVITDWHDRLIGPGQEWKDQIDTHLEKAQIILLLISADFMASDYCYDNEMTRAMERHAKGEARVIPIVLRHVDWEESDFSKLQCLPKDALPVTDWPTQDKAFKNITEGIRKAAKEIRREQRITAPSAPLIKRRRRLLVPISIALLLAAIIFYGYREWDRRLENHLAEGERFINIGRYTDAQREYQQASKLCPFCSVVRWGLAKAELYDPSNAGQFEDRFHWLQAQSRSGVDPHVWVFKGNLNVLHRKPEQAISDYQTATSFGSHDAEAYYRLAIVYQQQGELQKALENYLQAVEKADPVPPQYLANLASLYVELKEYDKAMEYFNQLADSNFLLGHQEIALLQRLQGKLSEAVGQQRQLAQLLDNPKITELPENQDPWYFETDKERIEFHNLPSKKAYVYYSLSATLYLLGQETEAQEYLHKAKALQAPKEEEVKAVVTYDLQRLATEQPRWKQRSEDYWQRFLITTSELVPDRKP